MDLRLIPILAPDDPAAQRTFPLPDAAGYPFDVVGLGLNAVDRILEVDRYPARGGKEEIRSERILPGGQVASALAACRALGLCRVRYAGKVGDDEFGALQLRSLEAAGLDLEWVRVETGTTSQQAVIVIDGQSGERTIFWRRSDRLNFRPGELSAEAICAAPMLHLDGHDQDAAVWCAGQARRRGIRTVLDIDRPRSRTEELLGHINFCICSEHFPRHLTGEAGLEEGLRAVGRLGPGLVAATLGPLGAAVLLDNGLRRVPGFRVDCVDSTGAGDIFHGAFIYALRQGWPLGRLLRFANAAAALKCTAWGARGGLRPAAEVSEFMRVAPRGD